MVDFSIDPEDKKDFITGIHLNDDLKTFTISYGDGRNEVEQFTSVHNFNVYVYRMEEQYYRYKDEFSKEMVSWLTESIKKSFVELILSIGAIILTVNVVPNNILRIFLIVLTILFSLLFQFNKLLNIATIGFSLNYLENVKKFIDIQEKLKVPVIDPNTGREDDWYLANLSDVNLDTNIDFYEMLTVAYADEEVKKEHGLVLSKKLKGE